MSRFLDELTDQLNLRWAWEKVRREATPGDNWFDEVELARFELELEGNLQSIAADFEKGRYRLTSLRPLPLPRNPDEEGNSRLRQVFQVAVRDQVAWTAVVNVVGPYVDSKMPAWSYGNRLYRSIWVQEDDDGVNRRKIGRYRHASGRLYLPFGQSWPIFRRHVCLATRAMTTSKELPEMDERTEEELEFQKRLADEHRCAFVMSAYWQRRRPRKGEPKLYWCSLDLERFYPTMRLLVVQENIVEQLPHEWQSDASRLLESMCRFRLDLDEWKDDELKKMDIRPDRSAFPHIPTGLYVAGFLANAGLLKVDLEVARRLAERRVAHFRYVDDHIMLAYSFDELCKWVKEYTALLAEGRTGAKLNPKKVEPGELAGFFATDNRKRKGKKYDAVRKVAEKKCCLDPQFPSPLMTKTLALVSGIARTDFNLLEPGELAALNEQLEHLLLVDLPEEEIPEKTRLSFAATRLIRIAECRLANDESLAVLGCKQQAKIAELAGEGLADDKRRQLEQELTELRKDLSVESDRRNREVIRAFQLLRKVLRERPDRVRLWTRAVLMCRLTGVKGLGELRDDIRRERERSPLAAEYLQANMLALLGTQTLIAARVLRDEGVAHWRRQAARAFLEDVIATKLEAPNKEKDRSFLHVSWNQYCFGVYCADLVLRDEGTSRQVPPALSFPKRILGAGNRCLGKENVGHGPVQWAWWAGRMTLRDLVPRADGFVKVLGNVLKPSRSAAAFWRFFPLDAPTAVLRYMAKEKYRYMDSATLGGWWYDALRDRRGALSALTLPVQGREIRRVDRGLRLKHDNTISLYDWGEFLLQPGRGMTDPRTGEWTALEIIRQIVALLDEEPMLAAYLKVARGRQSRFPWIHPANFWIPRSWIEGEEPTWSEWRRLVREDGKAGSVAYVPKSIRIVDKRYTPLNTDNPLFMSVNPVRGLGILLYGLLKKSFDLPAAWNGPGHADLLGMLPTLLLADMTCSSWTLGLLQGCLQPRATENLFLKAHPLAGKTDDDTLRDPVAFLNAKQVALAVQKCQEVLEDHQLSTLHHKARQLTPVSIRQLTEPEWSKVFDFPVGGGSADE